MAQTNFTPILTYKSDTASSVPSASNLTNSANGAELAVNTADKRLFTKDSGGNVVELGTNPSSLTMPNGTANGVVYANGSKVLTSGSALTFDGTTLTSSVGTSAANTIFNSSANTPYIRFDQSNAAKFYIGESSAVGGGGAGNYDLYAATGLGIRFFANAAEGMRLTSTGLGIGTSSPAYKLDVDSTAGTVANLNSTNASGPGLRFTRSGTANGYVGSAKYVVGGALADFGIDVSGANNLVFGTNDVERMRIDSSGNLGLGVTPSAWNSAFKAIDFSTTASLAGSSGGANLFNNAYYNGTDYIYKTTAAATRYLQSSGEHNWFRAASGTAGNAISFTQAMTLDASGNLGIGTTSPINILDINTASPRVRVVAATGTNSNLIQLVNTGGTAYVGLDNSSGSSLTSAYALNLYHTGAYPIVFSTNNTERARIDSSGNLLVGKTSASTTTVGAELQPTASAGYIAAFTSDAQRAVIANRLTSDGELYSMRRSGTVVGTISVTTSATAYNTSSDYRLKENIQPMQNALGVVAQLNPVTYNWKADGSASQGFIAHELQAVVPDCVTGEKDAIDAEGNPVYQGIDTSFLVATLTAAIQEQQAQIESLTKRLADAGIA